MLETARTRALIAAFQERILVIDGAMGTALQARKRTLAELAHAPDG